MDLEIEDLGLNKREVRVGGNAGLVSNTKLIAVFVNGGMFRANDLYRRPDNSQRHLNEWAEDRGVAYEDITAVSSSALTRLLLGIK